MRKALNLLGRKQFMGILNCLALFFTVYNARLLCFWYAHQPEFPAEADKFRKFK